MWRNGLQTTFVGLDAVRKIEYRTTRNEYTRCNFCKNDCLRTSSTSAPLPKNDLSFVPDLRKSTKVPLDARRAALDHCDLRKGMVEDINDMKGIKAGIDQIQS